MPVILPDRSACFWLMPKTGSSFLMRYLRRYHCAEAITGQHDPALWMFSLYGLVANLAGVSMHVGTICPAHTWYARLWRHDVGGVEERDKPTIAEIPKSRLIGKKPKPRILAFSSTGGPDGDLDRLSFKAWLYGATHPQIVDVETLGRNLIWELRPGAPKWVKGGLWSHVARYMYCSWQPTVPPRGWTVDTCEVPASRGFLVNVLIDTTQMAEALDSLGVASFEHVERQRAYNTAHGRESRVPSKADPPEEISNYEDWYDEEMIGWVNEADKALRLRLGYGPLPFERPTSGQNISIRATSEADRQRAATATRVTELLHSSQFDGWKTAWRADRESLLPSAR